MGFFGFSSFRVFVDSANSKYSLKFSVILWLLLLSWQKSIEKQTKRKQSIQLSRGSTAGNDCGHEAPSEIKKRVLRLSFIFMLREELSNSIYPSHLSECKASGILLN